MKKRTILGLLALSSILQAHSSEPLMVSTKGMGSFFHKIEDFFHKPASLVSGISLPAPVLFDVNILSPFQMLFRETVSFTHSTNNALCSLAQNVMQEAEEELYTLEQASERFIEEIQLGGTYLMHKILLETLDVDLEKLIPEFMSIHQYIATLQQRVTELTTAPIIDQLQDLLTLVETTQEKAERIQQEGLVKLSAQLASSALFGTHYPLVDCFNELYAVYPTVIQKIDRLYLRETGLVTHSIFNLSSELIEQLIFFHESAGKIGTLFIHDGLISTLDISKNRIRKLGNALEFVTSTQPLIVVAPPTTTDALIQILQSCVWGDGLKLRPLVMKEIDNALKIAEPLVAQIEPYTQRLEQFTLLVTDLPSRLHANFLNLLRESPAHNIPRSPLLLLELLEEEVAAIREELHMVIAQPINLTHQLCTLLTISSRLLTYTNSFMGSTKELPFIHPDIIRGLGFVAEDVNGLSTIIVQLMDEIDQFKLLHRGKMI